MKKLLLVLVFIVTSVCSSFSQIRYLTSVAGGFGGNVSSDNSYASITFDVNEIIINCYDGLPLTFGIGLNYDIDYTYAFKYKTNDGWSVPISIGYAVINPDDEDNFLIPYFEWKPSFNGNDGKTIGVGINCIKVPFMVSMSLTKGYDSVVDYENGWKIQLSLGICFY